MNNVNKKVAVLLIASVAASLMVAGGCGAKTSDIREEQVIETTTESQIIDATVAYRTISSEEAKEMMDTIEDYVLVDVRSQDEYDSGYIAGAILIPHTQMREMASGILLDKDQVILIYCRSGRRSAYAAKVLSSMGYTQVYDFGGIIDWPYETVRDET